MAKIIRKISSKRGGNLTIQDLEDLAHTPQAFKGYANKTLSYFSGNPQNFTQMNENAALLLGQLAVSPFLTTDQKSGGISEFITSKQGKNSFSIKLVNSGSSDITMSLFAGAFRGTSLAPNALKDSVTNMAVTSETDNKLVEHLIAHINANPSLLLNIRVFSTEPAQVMQKFTLRRKYAFSDDATKAIDPSDFKTPNQTIDTFLNLAVKEVIDDATILSYPVLAGKSVTLTFFFGPSFNKNVAMTEFVKAIYAASNFVGENAIQKAAAAANFTGFDVPRIG